MLLLMLSVPCVAQVPDAPKPRIDKIEWSLFAADVGVRTIDTISTSQLKSRGAREVELPDFVAYHIPVLIAFEGGQVALHYFIAKKLIKHNHRKWAYMITLVDIGTDGYGGIHNLFLHGPQPTMSGVAGPPIAVPIPDLKGAVR
jgi:hypothetical protein